ncbi:MAG: hypothetical protein R2817_07385 [Flavobacteriales bacterium]
MRSLLFLLAVALGTRTMAQPPGNGNGSALTFARSVNVALNGVQLHDKAMDAWTWTFGKQPGARVLSSDRASGAIDGTARFNFRSTMLTMREETMGVVQYKVTIRVNAGECRILVSELTHTGNRNTTLGGVHVGPLIRGPWEGRKLRGMSRTNAQQLHEELQTASEEQIRTLLNAFEARLRANAGE